MATIEEIEAERAARKAALAAQRLEQLATDLQALNDLEIQHGDGKIVRVDIGRYVPGLPTMVIMRLPKPVEFKRYTDMIAARGDAPGEQLNPSIMLAESCRLYPAEKEDYERVKAEFTGLHINAAVALRKACEGSAVEEGKG